MGTSDDGHRRGHLSTCMLDRASAPRASARAPTRPLLAIARVLHSDAAPEVHAANQEGGGPEYLAAGADVWSAGVCLFAMLATQVSDFQSMSMSMFHGHGPLHRMCLLLMLASQLPFGGGEDSDEEVAELRAKVCSGQPDAVPEWSEYSRCPSAFDLAEGMLRVDPAERFSLDDVCDHEWVGGLEHVPWRTSQPTSARH